MSTSRGRASAVNSARVAAKAVPSCTQAAAMPSLRTHHRALAFRAQPASPAPGSLPNALRGVPLLLLASSSASAAG